MSDRLKRAFDRAWGAAKTRQYIEGVLGRVNPDGSITFWVPDRPGFVYVRTGSGGTLTPDIARNIGKGQVPVRANLPILLLRENGVLTIEGENTGSGLLDDDSGAPPSDYGVPSHPHALSGLSDVLLTALANGEILAWDATAGKWINVTQAGALVTSVNGQTGAVMLDADDIAETATREWFTPAEATKLAGIEAGAEVNVNADWTAISGDAQILNKPSIPADTATAISGAATDDTIADADLFGYVTSGVLVKTAWSNIKALLTTLFNGLYVALTGNQTVAGIKSFTSDLYVGTSTPGAPTASLYIEQDGTFAGIHMASYRASGTRAGINGYAAAGSKASPATLPSGHLEYSMTGNAWDGSAFQPSAQIRMLSPSAHGAGSVPGRIDFRTTPAGSTTLADAVTIDENQRVGIGPTTPQGKLHAHDGTGGMMFVSKTGIVGTAQTIIPDGAGDVVRGVHIRGVIYNSNGDFAAINQAVANGGSAVIDTSGGLNTRTLTFAVSAAGALTVVRSAGTHTWQIAVELAWL